MSNKNHIEIKAFIHNILLQMKTKLEEQLVKFAKEKFQDFINDTGGFNDILVYIDHVKNNRLKHETSTGSSIFSRTTMVAGALALGAMFFAKP